MSLNKDNNPETINQIPMIDPNTDGSRTNTPVNIVIIPKIIVVNPMILNGAKYEPLNNAIIPIIIKINPNK